MSRLRKIPAHSIVEVLWEDAGTNSGDASLEDIRNHKPILRTAIGRILRNDKSYVAVAACDDRQISNEPHALVGHPGIADVTVIPRSIVRSIRLVEKPQKKV
jgi:hypothetical protein